MTRTEYNRLIIERQQVIRENAGRRLMGMAPLPVPPKPSPPMGWELTDEEGIYAGFTAKDDEKNEFLAGHPKRKAKRKEAL